MQSIKDQNSQLLLWSLSRFFCCQILKGHKKWVNTTNDLKEKVWYRTVVRYNVLASDFEIKSCEEGEERIEGWDHHCTLDILLFHDCMNLLCNCINFSSKARQGKTLVSNVVSLCSLLSVHIYMLILWSHWSPFDMQYASGDRGEPNLYVHSISVWCKHLQLNFLRK